MMRLLVLLTLATLLFCGCGKTHNSIVDAHPRAVGDPARVEQDPWVLMPKGALVFFDLNAQALFASKFGPDLLRLIVRRIPVPVGAGFEPQRDLQHIHMGLYSMQGADFVAVARGRFDSAQLHGAAERGAASALGVPFAKTRYTERDVYVAEELAFTVLTPSVTLFGNQMGVRRALDRLYEGRLVRDTPKWFDAQLGQPAPIVVGMNIKKNPMSEATRNQLPFVVGLETVGIVANFQEPGMHFAGTFGYEGPAAADQGAANLRTFNDTLRSFSGLMALMGMGQPVERLETRAEGNVMRFVAALNGQVVSQLVSRADSLLPLWGQPAAVAQPVR